jgi:hypothetical protein
LDPHAFRPNPRRSPAPIALLEEKSAIEKHKLVTSTPAHSKPPHYLVFGGQPFWLFCFPFIAVIEPTQFRLNVVTFPGL